MVNFQTLFLAPKTYSEWFLALVDGIEWVLRFMGRTFRDNVYKHWAGLVVQAGVGLAGATLSAIEIQRHPERSLLSLVFGIIGVIFGFLGLGFMAGRHRALKRWFRRWKTRFYAIQLTIKVAGSIAILKGFVALSNEIGERKKLNGWAISFFLSCYLIITSVVKLYKKDDAFGTADSLMAVAVMIFVNFPNERIEFKATWCFFYGIVFLLCLFKVSEIPLIGDVWGVPAAEDDDENPNAQAPADGTNLPTILPGRHIWAADV